MFGNVRYFFILYNIGYSRNLFYSRQHSMSDSRATGEIFFDKRLEFSDFLLYYTITARRSVDTAGFFTSARQSEKKLKKICIIGKLFVPLQYETE